MGSQHEQTSCWQSSFKCQYTGHLGMNVAVCIMWCGYYAPLSCKSVGTKGCVTGFQASTGAVYENLLSFNSWVLARCTREIASHSHANLLAISGLPKRSLLTGSSYAVIKHGEKCKKCFLRWHAGLGAVWLMITSVAIQVKLESLQFQASGQVAVIMAGRNQDSSPTKAEMLRRLKPVYFSAASTPCVIPSNCTSGWKDFGASGSTAKILAAMSGPAASSRMTDELCCCYRSAVFEELMNRVFQYSQPYTANKTRGGVVHSAL